MLLTQPSKKINRRSGISLGPLVPMYTLARSKQLQSKMPNINDNEPPAVWQSVGRGTPAGRALFNLFSDNVNGKQTGDKFSARNKAVLEAKIAMGWRPSIPGMNLSVDVRGKRRLQAVTANCLYRCEGFPWSPRKTFCLRPQIQKTCARCKFACFARGEKER